MDACVCVPELHLVVILCIKIFLTEGFPPSAAGESYNSAAACILNRYTVRYVTSFSQ